MISNYCRGVVLIFIISLCINALSVAQTTLKDSVISKQEQIRPIAYGTQAAWMVTGAISTVTGNELGKSFTPNFANTLFGRLPGLTVNQGSGEAGADSPVLFGRGLNTFGPGGSPLIIVDGFENKFEQLNPDEVESVSLLKDASATAMYGLRGANGVLLITTKRGKEGPLVVNFSTQQGVQSALRLPDFLGSYDYARLYNEALINDGKTAMYTQADLDAYHAGNDPFFHPDVNWYKEVLRSSAYTSNYALDFSGGNNRVKYFVLLNALRSDGLFKKFGDLSPERSINATYKEYNFRTNVDINLTKRLSAAVTLGIAIADKANPVDDNTGSIFTLISSVAPNAFPVYNPNKTFGGIALYDNPVGNLLQTGWFTSNRRTLQSSLKLTEQLDMLTPGLSASVAISFNNTFRGTSAKSRTYQRYSLLKGTLGDTIYNVFGNTSSLESSESYSDPWQNVTFQTFLNYNRAFNNHRIDATLMYILDNYTIPGDMATFKHLGTMGRFTYINHDKYIGEFSFGYEGTEAFAKGKRFGFTPAVSLGWIVSNEEFLKGSNIFNYLKIRGSYGLVGNDNTGADHFSYNQYSSFTSSYYFGRSNSNMNGIAQINIANPDLTWEKEKKFNIGFEATILKNIDVSLDIFQQDRYDILTQPNETVPLFIGMVLPSLNLGKVNNKGFEATVRFNGNQGGKLQYFVEGNVWYATNKIIYNAETVQMYPYLNRTGNPVNQPFLLQALGLFKDQSDINSSPHQSFGPVQPGDIKYKDQNGDNVIDQNDYYPSGHTSVPDLTASLKAGVKFNGFDLDFLFQGVTDRSVYLSGSDFYAFQNNGKISSFALNRWTTATAATADYPRLSAQNNMNNFQPSTFWQHDGSFIKLRSIELGYSLSKKIVDKIHLSSARLFINGTNLFSLDHVKITDPETLTGYAAVRSISLGAKIQF